MFTDMKACILKLENENTDLKFLNTQYLQKLCSFEKECSGKSTALCTLQKKNGHAVIDKTGTIFYILFISYIIVK